MRNNMVATTLRHAGENSTSPAFRAYEFSAGSESDENTEINSSDGESKSLYF